MNVPVLLIYGTSTMLILVSFIIYFVFRYQRRLIKHHLQLKELEAKHQRTLLRAMINTQEAERKRIAQNLHGDVGGMISAIRLKVSQLKPKSGKTTLAVKDIKTMLDDTLDTTRHISHNLIPTVLKKFGIQEALEDLLENLKGGSFQYELSSSVNGRLDNEVELATYRIFQELITNSIRHAEASKIELKIKVLNNSLVLEYADNGKGFHTRDLSSPGLGLKSIESRVRMLDGSLKVSSNKGVHYRILIPLEHGN